MEKEQNLSELFGINVFREDVMRQYLPEREYQDLQDTIRDHEEIKPDTAAAVAEAMKKWAVSRGATHYTHWFQPMTNGTAEKHDSFLLPPENGKAILKLSAKELMKGETDASSFPSGGLRATFEARGYTAWDCTSPAFLKEGPVGTILCIPTAFCSYTGEALDQKTPLLRSMQALNRETLRLLRLLGDTTTKSVRAMVGAEQEYFLVDRKTYLKREDLVFTGRTLFGAPAPKGQELDDHYYGSIRERIGAFMKDVNEALWKMGVPAKTQHNEAAPAQHELACIYDMANIATDQNQIVMDTLRRIAYRHDLQCLLDEKPFAGCNGSGKHDNWSLVTDQGVNLVNPGKHPHDNIQFLLILACILRAIDRHADLLREAAACPGNDNRLGANEAPPAIISVFLGEQLDDVLRQWMDSGIATHSLKRTHFQTGVVTLPDFMKDVTDRNRTSPVAFTGNKFEFRMVGSSDSVAEANIVINTIVAEAFAEAADELEKADDIPAKVNELISRYVISHYRVVFNGNGYSEEWTREAERRGLPNLPSMVDAIPALLRQENMDTMARFGVLSESEMRARAEIKYEAYINCRRIEARTMVDMVNRQILPAGIRFMKEVAESLVQARSAGVPLDLTAEESLLMEVSELNGSLKAECEKLLFLTGKAEKIEEIDKKARFIREKIVPTMDSLRKPADRLELLVRSELWPFPTYRELQFEV